MELCRRYGFEGLFPIDNEQDAENEAARIFASNCERMDRADIALFNLTPFRGPSADAGTVFELGYCYAKKKKIRGYSSVAGRYLERVRDRYGTLNSEHRRNLDPEGRSVEDFGLIDNLMIALAAGDQENLITIVEEPSLAALAAFEACLAALAKRGP